MKNGNQNNVVSFSLFSICFILSMIFMVLKLCHVIDWSWVLVFLPLIIDAGLAALLIIVIVICKLLLILLDRD